MWEILALPFLAFGAALIPSKKTDLKKIDEVFENMDICIKKGESIMYPKLRNKKQSETHSTYSYSLPNGLPSDKVEVAKIAICEALKKEIDIEYKGILLIRAYKNKLPDKWKYDEGLIREKTWEVPIGKNHEGILYHDFDKYPHMLIGGVTRFGKTVFMKNIFNTLLINQPANSKFYFLDLKGGLEFSKYLGLPQVKGVASDVYEAVSLLDEIIYLVKEREKLFKQNGWTNVVDSPIKERIFVIVDEGAELSPKIVQGEKKKYAEACQSALSEIARIAGGLGVRLVYGTQYPTKEAVPMQIKMNIVARVSFVCAAQIASRVLLDEIGAESLPAIPGRAIYKIEKNRIVQAPYIDDKMMFKMMEEAKVDDIQTGTNREVIDHN
ncbi:FtsK/SpoIIIE domain-containing protein [Bacillus sp. 2205SS5-2]|uniref:FtsK/SpoIIIE domain-containing protein n=1 Tax=Bacillus sp. 2205SS5-2 TaxID=3109031 RepID=UPI00300741F3